MSSQLDIFGNIEVSQAAHVDVLADPASGLRAFLVLDDLTLGPAAGGIRTLAYPSPAQALADALDLARAMTIKCALAGLPTGGAKCVVMDHPGLDRERAFAALGRRVRELGGLFQTAGDLGTTLADLRAAAGPWVHVDEGGLALGPAVGRTVLEAARAALALDRDASLAGRRVAVQGAGVIGAAVAAAAASAGAEVAVADLDEAKARAVIDELRAAGHDAEVLPAGGFPAWDADVLSPCARGGVLDDDGARSVKARVVVPGANHALTGEGAEEAARARGVVVVPDVLSSSGAVIAGIARTVMGVSDPGPMLARVYDTTLEVLAEARSTGALPSRVARARAARLLEEAGGDGDRIRRSRSCR